MSIRLCILYLSVLFLLFIHLSLVDVFKILPFKRFRLVRVLTMLCYFNHTAG